MTIKESAMTAPTLIAPRLGFKKFTGRRRRLSTSAKVAGGFLLLMVLVALIAPVLSPYDPIVGDATQRLLPLLSDGHVLGTDGQGRDVLSRLIWGARPSLLAGIIPVIIGGGVGTVLGLVAGLGSARVNSVVMRILDVFYAFPAVMLAIAISAALGPGISNAILALSLVNIPPVARVAETEVLRIKDAAFMETARLSGASWFSIAFRQALPAAGPGILVFCTGLIGLSIVYAAGLGFLGLGLTPPNAEWGLMVNELRQYTFSAPIVALVPAVLILIVSIACNALGDGLRDRMDVRMEARA